MSWRYTSRPGLRGPRVCLEHSFVPLTATANPSELHGNVAPCGKPFRTRGAENKRDRAPHAYYPYCNSDLRMPAAALTKLAQIGAVCDGVTRIALLRRRTPGDRQVATLRAGQCFGEMARPAPKAPFASRSLLCALLTPQMDPGFNGGLCYRCGKGS